MLFSDLDIAQIAREVGMPNLSQFSKLIHQQTGISPKLYIQKGYHNQQ